MEKQENKNQKLNKNTKTEGEGIMIKKLINFFKDEEGATMVEYGIMVALIAAVCIVVVGLLGTELNEVFDEVLTALENR